MADKLENHRETNLLEKLNGLVENKALNKRENLIFTMTWCFKTSIQLPKGRFGFVEKWPMSNPNELVFVLVTYLAFVFKIGPYIMEKRRPLQIKTLLFVFNGFKVINSAILAYRIFLYIMDKGLFPRNCDHDDSTVYTIAALYWKYMVTKGFDLFDTIFFVLRKKQSQITFLHVYHHVFMVIISWSAFKYDPSDHWAFMAVVNCSIHTVMYIYYGISALGPRYAKYLWWKKYITVMQMIQFVLIISHLIIQTYSTQCPMHASTYWIGLSNSVFFAILFADFYRKRYKAQNKEVVEFGCFRHID